MEQGKLALKANELRSEAVRFELLDPGVDQCQPFGDPPGSAKGFRQQREAGGPPKAKIGLDDLVEAGIQQLRFRDDIATHEDDGLLKPGAERAPERQVMFSGTIDQHASI